MTMAKTEMTETQNIKPEKTEDAFILDMADREYHAITDRLSKHTLEEFAANPWKFFKLRANPERAPETDTAVFALGRAVHAAVLTPDVFEQDFVAMPAEIKSKRGKAWEEFKAANEGKEILTADQMELSLLLAQTVAASSAQDFLSECPLREVTALWTGFMATPMKSRFDALSTDCTLIADLKTCQCCNAEQFVKDADSYGYDIQAAIYIDALRSLGKDPQMFAFLCVEKTFPFAVCVHTFTPECDFVNAGRHAYQQMLTDYQTMRDAGADMIDLVASLPTTRNLAPVPWSKRLKAWRSLHEFSNEEI